MSVEEYIAGFIASDGPHLAQATLGQGGGRGVLPSVGAEVGRLLALLIRVTQAKRVLELGACLGYSALWMADALRATGGRLVSVEYDEALHRQAVHNIAAAALSGVVDLVCADARDVVRQCEGPFDLILLDCDKDVYLNVLDGCIRLLRLGGVLLADDALFKPMGIVEKMSDPIHRYNQRVFSDPRLYSTILPVGDGVAVSVKVRE